jgi:hypothetical protein
MAAWEDMGRSRRQEQIPPLWDGQAGSRCRDVLRQYFPSKLGGEVEETGCRITPS